jgi:hypothetical protein
MFSRPVTLALSERRFEQLRTVCASTTIGRAILSNPSSRQKCNQPAAQDHLRVVTHTPLALTLHVTTTIETLPTNTTSKTPAAARHQPLAKALADTERNRKHSQVARKNWDFFGFQSGLLRRPAPYNCRTLYKRRATQSNVHRCPDAAAGNLIKNGRLFIGYHRALQYRDGRILQSSHQHFRHFRDGFVPKHQSHSMDA